jgi:hypothetical protein
LAPKVTDPGYRIIRPRRSGVAAGQTLLLRQGGLSL